MDAAIWIALEELGDWRVLAQRLEQFDFGVRQRNEDGVHAVVRLRHDGGHVGAERVAIQFARPPDVADRNGDVIETADHANFSCGAGTKAIS